MFIYTHPHLGVNSVLVLFHETLHNTFPSKKSINNVTRHTSICKAQNTRAKNSLFETQIYHSIKYPEFTLKS